MVDWQYNKTSVLENSVLGKVVHTYGEWAQNRSVTCATSHAGCIGGWQTAYSRRAARMQRCTKALRKA